MDHVEWGDKGWPKTDYLLTTVAHNHSGYPDKGQVNHAANNDRPAEI